jgi:hypothetical protein
MTPRDKDSAAGQSSGHKVNTESQSSKHKVSTQDQNKGYMMLSSPPLPQIQD